MKPKNTAVVLKCCFVVDAAQVRTKDMLFDSISHLIAYHLKNELPIVAAESELHLKQVVRRKL